MQLEILYLFAPCRGTNVKIGVPENYDGIFPWYLTKVIKLYLFYGLPVIWNIYMRFIIDLRGVFFNSVIFPEGLRCVNVLLSPVDFN